MGESKSMRLVSAIAAMTIFALSACSSAEDTCKDFPMVIYPSVTFKTCEKTPQYENTPITYTAFIESADSVEKVTKFYQTKVQASGWTVVPTKVKSRTHVELTLKKGIGYANIIIDTRHNKKGSSLQIHVYPFGN